MRTDILERMASCLGVSYLQCQCGTGGWNRLGSRGQKSSQLALNLLQSDSSIPSMCIQLYGIHQQNRVALRPYKGRRRAGHQPSSTPCFVPTTSRRPSTPHHVAACLDNMRSQMSACLQLRRPATAGSLLQAGATLFELNEYQTTAQLSASMHQHRNRQFYVGPVRLTACEVCGT
jgi:hypothetical protein